MHPVVLHDDAIVDAALSTAATLLGMEVVYVGFIDRERDTYRFDRVVGETGQITEGEVVDFADTFCQRMLAGASPMTCDAAADPVYGTIPPHPGITVVSYVGVPIRDQAGEVIGTLCGFDSRRIELGDHVVGVLTELASVISARVATRPLDDVLIRRTPAGWSVGDVAHETSLTAAMVLADLLAADVSPPSRPERAEGDLDEVARLRASVAQLEHALAARVVIEQGIGVVAARSGVTPREAFEALRRVARRSGRRVHDLARDVVRSVTEPGVDLPSELAAG